MVSGDDAGGDAFSGAGVGALEVKPKRARAKPIEARLVQTAGTSYLVEWVEGNDLRRAWVPGEAWIPNDEDFFQGHVEQDTLNAGAAYGVLWEEVIILNPLMIGDLARELRASGIWTIEDFRGRLGEVVNLFQSALRLDVQHVLRSMEEKG